MSKQEHLIEKILTALGELGERTTEPVEAQILLRAILAAHELRRELVPKGPSAPTVSTMSAENFARTKFPN
jgi:hypothetical protein